MTTATLLPSFSSQFPTFDYPCMRSQNEIILNFPLNRLKIVYPNVLYILNYVAHIAIALK